MIASRRCARPTRWMRRSQKPGRPARDARSAPPGGQARDQAADHESAIQPHYTSNSAHFPLPNSFDGMASRDFISIVFMRVAATSRPCAELSPGAIAIRGMRLGKRKAISLRGLSTSCESGSSVGFWAVATLRPRHISSLLRPRGGQVSRRFET